MVNVWTHYTILYSRSLHFSAEANTVTQETVSEDSEVFGVEKKHNYRYIYLSV